MIHRYTPLQKSPIRRRDEPRKSIKIGFVRKRKGPSKYKRRKRDIDYLLWLKTQPCAVCAALPSDAAHVGARGLSNKCPDWQAVPLCHELHHQEGPDSHHVLQKLFWDFHGLDRDKLIEFYNTQWVQLGNTFNTKSSP